MTIEYHEPPEELTPETRDIHRAITSLVEELEAVDWYNMRADATQDENLRGVLVHNRDEEMEHAAMLIEWLRRAFPVFDGHLATYLNTTAPIAEIEEAEKEEPKGDAPHAGSDSLGIGRLS
jgi:hypothetical protein